MKVTHLIIGLLGLLSLGWTTPVLAQDIDSTAVHASSPYETAVRSLLRANTTPAEHYLSSLSKKEARLFDHRVLSAQILVHQLHTAKAKAEIAALLKSKSKAEKVRIELEQAQRQAEEIDRMLGNTFMVPVVSNHTDTDTKILEELHRCTAHLGTGTATSYTTADGNCRWEVFPTDEGHQPAFSIQYRLGDGSWDKEGMKVVEVNGISPEGKIAYPFLMADGQTLYFAYMGPETMGGYDLYVTRYDHAAGSLLVPQQLPIPFNSTADDLAYIVDGDSKVSYLLSWRATNEGEARLIVLKPDEQKRIDSSDPEALRRIALMDSVITADLPLIPLQPAVTKSQGTPKARLYISNRPIYKEDELSSQEARATFRRMEMLIGQRNRIDSDLKSMRQAIREGRKSSIAPRTVLEMEEKRLMIEQEIKALRNEVIRQERKGY